jgi:hypothetical protein
LVQVSTLLVAVLAVCRVWMLAWLAAQAVGRAAREQLAQAQRVKATTVVQVSMSHLGRVAAVAVPVRLVQQRRQAQAAMAVLGYRVRSQEQQPFMAVEQAAVRTAAPLVQVAAAAVLLALRH